MSGQSSRVSQVVDVSERGAEGVLERGDVLLSSDRACRIVEAERAVFSPSILAGGKNVSYDPTSGALGGSALSGPAADVLRGMMARFSDEADRFVRGVCPAYSDRLQRARTSFRPVEVAGRESSWRKDDTRLHIDSFPASPVQGWRILRVFTNVNPQGRPRSWRIGEDFEAMARRFAPALRMPVAGAAAVLSALGVTKTRRSPYDAMMLQLHDRMKADEAYQAGAPQASVDFQAGATWVAFTDQVSHAAMSGQYQLEQTFLLPVEAMLEPDRSPLRILERLMGRRLIG